MFVVSGISLALILRVGLTMSKAAILGFLFGGIISQLLGVSIFAGNLMAIGYVIYWIVKEGWE